MTAKEFKEKYGIKDNDFKLITHVLDKLYLEFTEPQILNMVMDYMRNADDIYNSL